MEMPKIAFLDTNVYLHYQPFDQIDWRGALQANSVTIVVPPVVVRELNQHKALHPRPRVRKRAATVLRRLTGLLESDSGVKLPQDTDVLIEDRDPTIDFAAHQLSHEVQDDQLIASVIMYKTERPEDDVVLVTSDTGLTLLAKAKRLAIATAGLPDTLKLPEEPDPKDKQLRELQHELQELKLRTPRLSLVFDDGSDHRTFVLRGPLELRQADLDSKLEDIKQRYPKRGDEPKPIPKGASNALESLSVHAMAAFSLGAVAPEEIVRYNSELDDFYTAYAEYFKRDLSLRNLERRTVRLEILLANDGTAPADDIDILMLFPSGFRLTTELQSLERWKPPMPPSKPRTPLEQLTESTRSFYDVLPSSFERYTMDSIIGSGNVATPNVSPPTITELDSYEVRFQVERIKHHMQECSDPLFVMFESFETAQSFHIDYQILAANVPHEVTGQLHVIVEKQ
jgi:hypothetical protein